MLTRGQQLSGKGQSKITNVSINVTSCDHHVPSFNCHFTHIHRTQSSKYFLSLQHSLKNKFTCIRTCYALSFVPPSRISLTLVTIEESRYISLS